ncbi:MAG: CDP-alcohol phosphatidyltransferase family protein [Bacteroidia bacterium]|nr:CDP-alcohol phosphatidyltransferase family protein [Bacteroidia bacterium]
MNWFNEYKNSLKMAEVEEIIDLIFFRPLAFLLVISVYHTKIKPDHLTLAAMLMGLAGGCFYSFGLHLSCILGALFFLLFNILDCSDGQLARLKKNGTSVGRLLDGIADYIATVAIFIGIAIGYSQKAEQPLLMLILLSLSGVSIIIQEVLVDYYRTRFLDIVMKRKNTFEEGIEEYKNEYKIIKNQKGKWFDKTIIFIYLIYSKVQRNLAARKKREKFFNTNPQDYFNKNRIIIRFWVFMGPSAVITTLILCSLFYRFDIFFWIIIGGFNILAVLLWIIQRQIDKSYVTL